jgi:hypothetical protein
MYVPCRAAQCSAAQQVHGRLATPNGSLSLHADSRQQSMLGPVAETEELVARWLAIFGRAQQYEAVMRNTLSR